jgi:cysteine desulfurase
MMKSKNPIRFFDEGRVYLDYAASTPVAPAVLKAMEPYFSKQFGNPGSIHYFGQKAQAAVSQARQLIAQAIKAKFSEIVFTGSATEANNLALRGVVRAFFQGLADPSFPGGTFPKQQAQRKDPSKFEQRARLIVSAIEHESILETARDLEKSGVEVVYLPVSREGLVDLNFLQRSLTPTTVLVSVIYASNEIGVIEPIKTISRLIKDFRGHNPYPLFHTDAVQAFQFLDCDVQNLGVDLLTLSAQKIYGPKGVGALYIRGLETHSRGVLKIKAIITGGGQEYGLRSGTENVPAIVGFGKAVELIQKNKPQEAERIRKLRDYFWDKLRAVYPKLEINGPALSSNLRLPNNLNIYFPGYSAQDLLIKFDLNGLAVSAGSACASRSTKISPVITALNLGRDRAQSSLRLSLGRPTSKKEIDIALKRIINLLR